MADALIALRIVHQHSYPNKAITHDIDLQQTKLLEGSHRVAHFREMLDNNIRKFYQYHMDISGLNKTLVCLVATQQYTSS